MTRRKVIFVPDDYWTNPPQRNPMTDADKPAAINRPLTDDERDLMRALTVRVIADQSGIPHTADDCRACSVVATVLDEFAERGEVHLYGDAVDCYMAVGPNEKLVHATREWLAFFAANPSEPIDLDHYRRPLPDDE
jgi:hypothetical protein